MRHQRRTLEKGLYSTKNRSSNSAYMTFALKKIAVPQITSPCLLSCVQGAEGRLLYIFNHSQAWNRSCYATELQMDVNIQVRCSGAVLNQTHSTLC